MNVDVGQEEAYSFGLTHIAQARAPIKGTKQLCVGLCQPLFVSGDKVRG